MLISEQDLVKFLSIKSYDHPLSCSPAVAFGRTDGYTHGEANRRLLQLLVVNTTINAEKKIPSLISL
jgi:hypothetical protein